MEYEYSNNMLVSGIIHFSFLNENQAECLNHENHSYLSGIPLWVSRSIFNFKASYTMKERAKVI